MSEARANITSWDFNKIAEIVSSNLSIQDLLISHVKKILLIGTLAQ